MIKKIIFLAAIASVIIIGVIGGAIWWMGPYGEEYLPEWIEHGENLVESIEEYKQKQGEYPETMPAKVDISKIPGCKRIAYNKRQDGDGMQYYTIHMYIHMRECVLYDSRRNLDEDSSWGTYRIMNDWMWTKD